VVVVGVAVAVAAAAAAAAAVAAVVVDCGREACLWCCCSVRKVFVSDGDPSCSRACAWVLPGLLVRRVALTVLLQH
jgi:hypothetical protein